MTILKIRHAATCVCYVVILNESDWFSQRPVVEFVVEHYRARVSLDTAYNLRVGTAFP